MYNMSRYEKTTETRMVEPKKAKKKAGAETGELKSIPIEEAEKIINGPNTRYITAFRNRMVMKMMLYCGLRVGEVCNLQFRDFDLKKGTFKVREGKTAAAKRTLTWPKEMDFELKSWFD